MKMSKESYDKLTAFYNITVEKATDADVDYILGCILFASKIAAKNIEKAKKKHGKN